MKTVIEMAREAGFHSPVRADGYMGLAYDRREGCETGGSLERFAELVRAEEREKWMERTAILIRGEREACHALRQTLPNPYEHCQVSAHAYDMAIAAYGAAIRARENT